MAIATEIMLRIFTPYITINPQAVLKKLLFVLQLVLIF